ncbi:alpha/beta hydrolase family protein [Levyella massiliensis]|uniref:alpha/beta hydrolase family protein n=1 Tax=Levyella massiliensis TaxID=938289 RepID=UPI00035E5D0A|nr:prolyl oligopeptidase family serine peptidase [Levyella massiliensis]
MGKGIITSFAINEDGLFWAVERDNISRVYVKFHGQKTEKMLLERQGKINVLIADNDNLYFCLSKIRSRFYYKAYRYDLKTGNCDMLIDEAKKQLNEFIVCSQDGDVFLTTNQWDVKNNEIACVGIQDCLITRLAAKKNGLLLLMDVHKNKKNYCYTNMHSNSCSDIFVYTPVTGHIQINSKDKKSINYGAKFLDAERILYITNEGFDRQGLNMCSLNGESELVYSDQDGEVDDYCIDEKGGVVYIKITCGVKDYILSHNIDTKKSHSIKLPEGATVVEKMLTYKGYLYIIAESENIRPTIYRYYEGCWEEIVSCDFYTKGYYGDAITIKTLNNYKMEVLVYKTPTAKIGSTIWLHGGPNAANRRKYNQLFSFFLRSGFDVIAPNYIGSTCYGREYMEGFASNGKCGYEMILQQIKELIEWGKHKNLFEKNIVICGESFGGYLSLRMVEYDLSDIILYINLFGPTKINNILDRFPEYMTTMPRKTFGGKCEEPDVIDLIKNAQRATILIISGSEDAVNNVDVIYNEPNISHVCIKNCGHGCSDANSYYEVEEAIKKLLYQTKESK